MQSEASNFRYLNRSGKWLDFHRRGLELTPQGALQLRSAPRLSSPPDTSTAAVAPDGPGGIAVDQAGRVFYSIPGENRVVTSAGCDPSPTPLTCLSERAGLGPLSAPRGLLVLEKSERLVVVDSGNHRLLFCDLTDFDVREVWGQADLSSGPAASDAPDGFSTPWSAAADQDEQNIYVLDTGNGRISKFARTGDVDADFAARIQYDGYLAYPSALAVSGSGETTRVFVADLSGDVIFVFDRSGSLVRQIQWPGMGNVIALAASETTLYVGDNDGRRILAFDLADPFEFNGEAAGFDGYVAALAVAPQSGALLVQTGNAAQPVSLDIAGAYLGSGVLWSDAISGGPLPVAWSRLRASVSNAAGSHVEFYYALSNTRTPAPAVDPEAEQPFGSPWRAIPEDVEDFLLGEQKAGFLFVGARFLSDRTDTPRLTQMRADFNADSFTKYLPLVYLNPGNQPDFLKRFVALFQGLFEDIEGEVNSLERYFDPYSTPAEALPWLASWLAVELEQGEPEARLRNSIAGAFRRYQWRGTIEGLRLALLDDAGVHAIISEPIAASSFLAFPSAASSGATPSALGLGTYLPSAQPGGAVLSIDATLDHSYLITDAEYGEPVFASVAWQFVIEVYRHEANTDARLQLIKDIIEREKPAHTTYRLALIDPAMRVGVQGRVGVDTVIAGVPPTGALGESREFGLRLGGPPPPRIGSSRFGDDLKL
ncbi:phage tail-like protein [Bradyrhizobium diazoefficiens]